MRDVKGIHIVVIGAAKSGIAVALLLKRKGADVFVSDHGLIGNEFKIKLETADIPFEESGHSDIAMKADLAVVSPGVPTETTLVQDYLNKGKEVFSEIEVASWFSEERIVAVTGSNGKTTVANWMDHLWTVAGRDHDLSGNIGIAFSDVVDSSGCDHLLEVSSFQLDHISTFRPDVSLILNITPDHLNRYENNFDTYAAAKFRITENQTRPET